jgi:AraC family transcriptional regulator, L-rhamnose operon transcriptional activator RhaR
MTSTSPLIGLEHLTTRTLFAPVGVPFHVHMPTHDGDVPLHDHDFFEIAVVLAGVGVHRTIHGESPIAAGDVFILHPGQWHAYERCRSLQLCNCLLGVELLTREIGWGRSDPHLAPLLPARLPIPGQPPAATGQGVMTVHLPPAALKDCLRELETLRSLQRGDPLRSRPEIIARLLLVLSILARAHGDSPAARAARSREADPSVLTAIQALEERLDHDWGLVELAKLLSLNRSYLVRLFKRHTGQSPMAWLARRRAEKAAVLLLTTDLPISVIGKQVGWHDPNYFARRFRAAFGQSAREYRHRLPCPALIRPAADWIQW